MEIGGKVKVLSRAKIDAETGKTVKKAGEEYTFSALVVSTPEITKAMESVVEIACSTIDKGTKSSNEEKLSMKAILRECLSDGREWLSESSQRIAYLRLTKSDTPTSSKEVMAL